MTETGVSALVIGSGAAGLASAVALHSRGIDPLVCTEGLRMGTSINTGSDKQTYYKLGMCGKTADSPYEMAQDLCAGGSMHGDIALTEASLSPVAFANLVLLGVPFPHDSCGAFPGYRTDHDPKSRAASCGPYTSRDMCRALIAELQRRKIRVREKMYAVELLVKDGVCGGAVFLREDGEFEIVRAAYTVFAAGGPGGLYEKSVYPAVHTGAVGLALAAGAKARNLAESQFGLTSLKFRWNVSGSYMQVLPRFVSVDSNGNESEFLRGVFGSDEKMREMIFLKGYQWPFAAGHVPGSSQVDLEVNRETGERGRRVFLDYRRNPSGNIPAIAAEYLGARNALGGTPAERLRRLNEPAYDLYRKHGIDLETEMLEVGVCAQHCNGGLAGDVFWESENIRGLFPVGEVNGSHGVTRPGGSALNAGQCGALRAAEEIARRIGRGETAIPEISAVTVDPGGGTERYDWRAERRKFQSRMSADGAFLRERQHLEEALSGAMEQWSVHRENGIFSFDSEQSKLEYLRNRQLLCAQCCYLSAILAQLEAGSRGGALVVSQEGVPVPEDVSFRSKTLETRLAEGKIVNEWHDCRKIPDDMELFENVWREYRERYGK